ncbi:hypothetical protein LTR27_006217 [Elasticomyces elasticus]|nr:hypothetical protein LTR27_006217 [Elasticomyces elasticus]
MAKASSILVTDDKHAEKQLRRFQTHTAWVDDRLNFRKHFLGEEGLTWFGDPRDAEEAYKEWILQIWKKSTGLELPGLGPRSVLRGKRRSPNMVLGDGEDEEVEASGGSQRPVKVKVASKRRKTRSGLQMQQTESGEHEQGTPKAATLPSVSDRMSIDLTMDEVDESVLVKIKKETPSQDAVIARKRKSLQLDLEEARVERASDLEEIKVKRALLELEDE